jgi:hypothetical protein
VSVDDLIPVPTSTTMNVKTFKGLDVNGNVVEVQAIVETDSDGAPIKPLSEATGQRILAALIAIDQKLALSTGTLPANL